MKLSIIVAASENNVIGRDNDLPWLLPDDMMFFRRMTEGHPIIMGRKNFESIGRVLPKRHNIIITRQPDYEVEGADVVSSLDEAITLAQESEADEAFVIGGGQIYEQAMPLCDRMYLTRVHAEVEGDVYFPEIDPGTWEEVGREEHEADEDHEFPFTFLLYDRK